jgi:hypothetical protein
VIRVRAVMSDVVPVDHQDEPSPPTRAIPHATSTVGELADRHTPSSSAFGDRSDEQEWDIVDEWGNDSFPASDPPANW